MSNNTRTLFIERNGDDCTQFGDIPRELQDALIPHARYYYYEDRDGFILDQHIQAGEFSIWQHQVKMMPGVQLQPYAPHQVYALHVSNNIPVETYEGDTVALRHKELSLFNVMPVPHQAMLMDDYADSFHINIEPSSLPLLAREFPVFRCLMGSPAKTVTGPLNDFPFQLNEVSAMVKDRILQCNYIGHAANAWFRRNAVDYFTNYLHQLSCPRTIMMSSDEQELFGRILAYILENLHQQDLTDAVIHHFNISGELLQAPFSQVFNISLPALILQERMARAFVLLMETADSYSDIMQGVGYTQLDAFTAAFKQYFGCDPIELRNAQ
ncbi:helix-turn-helix transcriptional regulator [Chitinophaga vietnamensis]|uniref:helix-turn-helix transcriptional regulator n=1 Tax=Chitinophaga vietnamensis TaxID=2593957 RepID=UPI0011783FA8|nr:AraC family transcriptional regulator [Chitinophaga vietnamensis]